MSWAHFNKIYDESRKLKNNCPLSDLDFVLKVEHLVFHQQNEWVMLEVLHFTSTSIYLCITWSFRMFYLFEYVQSIHPLLYIWLVMTLLVWLMELVTHWHRMKLSVTHLVISTFCSTQHDIKTHYVHPNLELDYR